MNTYTTDTGLYVLRDADGDVIAKADVPPGEHPLPDAADPSMCEDVADDTDMVAALDESPANFELPEDADDTAREKLAAVEVDESHKVNL